MVTINEIKNNLEIRALLEAADRQLVVNGYTEHAFRHIGIVSKKAGEILEKLGYSEREIELAKIAGFLHDIGNAINRTDHPHTGAILAYNILSKIGMDINDTVEVILAIGHHDENTGNAVSAISAAVILADKSDVHRERVRNTDLSKFEIHDRVNYAVAKSSLIIDAEYKKIVLDLTIDTEICPVMDYFEIFLYRMTMNRKAASFLGLTFQLVVNNTRLL